MSRDIKFRVWSKKRKDYRELDQLVFDNQGLEEIWVFPKDNETQQVYNPSEMVIEQYTGLKDKNGKEIYEGNIVNLEYYEKPFGKKRWNKTYPRKGGKDINIVGFEDGYFKFYEENENGYGSELSFSDYGEWEDKEGAYKYVAEVIGNIHKNPEPKGGEE